MKETIDGKTRLYPSDWRYSCAIVGLVRFFKFHQLDEHIDITDDYIEYEQEIVSDKEKYLLFCEDYFAQRMHHLILLELLKIEELSDEQIKLFNEKLSYYEICKKVFGKNKYSKEFAPEVSKLILENRLDLIENTFKNADSMYNKYSNLRLLFSESGKICRLKGYYVDKGKKTKALSYFWDKNTFVYEDELEFDFIPFAFTTTRESFFINNNYTIDFLLLANDKLKGSLENQVNEKLYPRKNLFLQNKKSSSYVDYDVEIITKTQGEDYFRTSYIRKSATNIFKKITEDEYNLLLFPLKMNDNFYIDIEKEVVNSILNLTHLDNLIENLIKKQPNKYFNTSLIIKINSLIYGGENMDDKIKKAKDTAFAVKNNIDDNKIKSYRQKLISAISFKDYDRFCQILLQLSDYSGVIFTFAYDLFDDFEQNKNIAYAFVNGLNDSKYNNGGKS